jgi:hypothetical protein
MREALGVSHNGFETPTSRPSLGGGRGWRIYGRQHAPVAKRSSTCAAVTIEGRSTVGRSVDGGATGKRKREPTRGTRPVWRDDKTTAIDNGRTCSGGRQ